MSGESGAGGLAGDPPPCRHEQRVDGVCAVCGHCEHDVILNGACFYCGTTELDGVAVSPKPASEFVPVARLLRKSGADEPRE